MVFTLMSVAELDAQGLRDQFTKSRRRRSQMYRYYFYKYTNRKIYIERKPSLTNISKIPINLTPFNGYTCESQLYCVEILEILLLFCWTLNKTLLLLAAFFF